MHTPDRKTTVRALAAGACLAAMALFASCDNFLDPKPNDVLAPENFYKSETDAIAAVNTSSSDGSADRPRRSRS